MTIATIPTDMREISCEALRNFRSLLVDYKPRARVFIQWLIDQVDTEVSRRNDFKTSKQPEFCWTFHHLSNIELAEAVEYCHNLTYALQDEVLATFIDRTNLCLILEAAHRLRKYE